MKHHINNLCLYSDWKPKVSFDFFSSWWGYNWRSKLRYIKMLIFPYFRNSGYDCDRDEIYILGFRFTWRNYYFCDFVEGAIDIYGDEEYLKETIWDKEEYEKEKQYQIKLLKRWTRIYL